MQASKDGSKAVDGDPRDVRTLLEILINPKSNLANWYVAIGTLGLFLAALNILGVIDNSYRVSWAGLLTLEYTNTAFEIKETAPSFVISDLIFILFCGALLSLGLRTYNSQEGGIPKFLKTLFVNETWPALTSTKKGGWQLTIGAWCLLIGIVFYLYWGIRYTRWIGPGVYVVAIALIASGMALRGLSSVRNDEN